MSASPRGMLSVIRSVGGPAGRLIEKAYLREPPPTLALIGPAGAGRSRTLDALFAAGRGDRAAAPVWSPYEPVIFKGGRGALRLYELPEPSDDPGFRLCVRVLPEADVVLWLREAGDRAPLDPALRALAGSPVRAWLADRLVFGLGKAELVEPAGEWHPLLRQPSERQEAALAGHAGLVAAEIADVLPEWRGQVVAYSARERYELVRLFKAMVHATPGPRRWLLERRMDIAEGIGATVGAGPRA